MSGDTFDIVLGLIPVTATISLSHFCQGSNFMRRLPDVLGTERSITELDFTIWAIDAAALTVFLNLSSGSLRKLRVRCNLSNEAYAAMTRCTRLRHLSLVRCVGLTDSHLRGLLLNVPDLESLELVSTTFLTDESLEQIYELKKLRQLDLGACNATNECVSGLGKIPTLHSLSLSLTSRSLSKSFFENVPLMGHLEFLVLRGCDMVPEWIGVICENLKKLRSLHLGDCRKLAEVDGAKFCRLRELRSLRFKNAVGFTDRTFENGVGSPDMKTLELDGCWTLSDVGLANIAAHHTKLEEFFLLGCERISDSGLVLLLQSTPLLKKLSIIDCSTVTDHFIEKLENLCPRLNHFHIHKCSTSDLARNTFRTRRPTVLTVD